MTIKRHEVLGLSIKYILLHTLREILLLFLQESKVEGPGQEGGRTLGSQYSL